MAYHHPFYGNDAAPCDGKLGRRSIEEGQMVNAGTTITYIIPTNNKWVIAN